MRNTRPFRIAYNFGKGGSYRTLDEATAVAKKLAAQGYSVIIKLP